MTSLVIDLPVVLISKIMTNWLSFRDISTLDTAWCNKHSRNEFVETLGSVMFAQDIHIVSLCLMNWLLSRKINARQINIYRQQEVTLQQWQAFLQQCGTTLKKISYEHISSDIDLAIATEILHYCPNIVEFELRTAIDNNTMILFIQAMPKLSTLIVDGVTNFNESIMLVIAQNCPKLKNLYMEQTRSTDTGMKIIAQHCPYLSSIFCNNITPIGVSALVTSCKRLEWLSLSGQTSISIREISQNCPLLVSLAMWKSEEVNDDAILQLISHCEKLKTLKLFSCIQLTNRSLCALKNLTVLALDDNQFVTDTTVEMIAQHCPDLTVVTLTRCRQLTQKTPFSLLASCRKLKVLQVYMSSFIQHCGQRTLLYLLAVTVRPTLRRLLLDEVFTLPPIET